MMKVGMIGYKRAASTFPEVSIFEGRRERRAGTETGSLKICSKIGIVLKNYSNMFEWCLSIGSNQIIRY
jgi:hypothetical protein